MENVSKVRRFFMMISFKVVDLPFKKRATRSFYIRKRILHKGYHILERTPESPRDELKFYLVKDCKDWESVTQEIHIMNIKLNFDIDSEVY